MGSRHPVEITVTLPLASSLEESEPSPDPEGSEDLSSAPTADGLSPPQTCRLISHCLASCHLAFAAFFFFLSSAAVLWAA